MCLSWRLRTLCQCLPNLLTTCSGKFSISSVRSKPDIQDITWQKMKTVIIEGNIGSGKTTLLNHFSHSSETMVIQEPVDKWTNLYGHNLLELLYRDPKRWASTFQAYALLTMVENHSKVPTSPIKIMERSIYSARYCFVENLYVNGFLHEIEYKVLSEWYGQLLKDPRMKVDLIVYLYTKPEVAYERIKARCRKEEEVVPFDYVLKLHDLHEQWLKGQAFPLPAPVLILDANRSMEEMLGEYQECEDIILRNG